MQLIENLVATIAPHECVGCGAEGSLLCSNCVEHLESVPSRCYRCKRWSADSLTCRACRRQTSIHSLWAVTSYDTELAKELLHRVKFERAKEGAKTIATLMAGRHTTPTDVVITHVPTAPTRIRARGYDQSALIAKALGRIWRQPYSPLLARIGNDRQLGQRREVRKQQMADAFRPIKQSFIKDEHILLIDDVLTTGATSEAAARTLRQAGAARVSCFVFAVA